MMIIKKGVGVDMGWQSFEPVEPVEKFVGTNVFLFLSFLSLYAVFNMGCDQGLNADL